MTELERRALLGDQEAQEECTQRGIALPCPCCGEKVEAIMNGQCVYHVRVSCIIDARLVSLRAWNRRPAPPIGRCGECSEYDTDGCSDGCGWCQIWDIGRFDDGFCDKFKPKEG